MSQLIDLIGQKFGRLVVIKRMANDKFGNSRWLCECDCGGGKVVLGNSLNRDHTRSCGCLRKEVTKKQHTKHGHRRDNRVTKIYVSWSHMIQRCTNSNHPKYKYYGGRGITVCDRWLKFENFNEDIGKDWKPGLQIDRVKNDQGYCKENCRWATKKQQMRNRRNNIYVAHNGKTQLLVLWSEETGIPYRVLWERIYRYDWSTMEALTVPVGEQRKGKNE